MIMLIGSDCVVTHNYNDTIMELANSKEWSFWMRTMQNLSLNSVRSFVKSMERFWIWSLYHETTDNERFPFYLARYREELQLGFTITNTIHIEDKEHEITIYTSKPMQKSTINKELAGIKSYFTYVEDLNLIEDSTTVNKAYERRKSANSFLSSVGVRKSGLSLDLVGKKREFIKAYNTSKKSSKTQKYFPAKYFDALVIKAEPREKLIYLLCGACSTRISQALNLTLYDIDYEKKEVWLLAPNSDDIDIYGNKRKRWLRNNYNINVDTDAPHNSPDLQFKYPIPCEHEPLHWLSDKYRDMFFEALIAYTKSKYYLPEFSRMPIHPFLFVTKTGNRVRSREINDRMKRTNYKISAELKLDDDLSIYSLHSLRHMYGHLMATLHGKTDMDVMVMLTKNAMGHKNIESTMVYFNMDYATKKEILKVAMKKINGSHVIDNITGEVYDS